MSSTRLIILNYPVKVGTVMLLEPFISVITLPGFFFIKLDVVVRTRLRVTIEKGFRIFFLFELSGKWK